MTCTICNQDLPESAFQTYFHKTQNTYRVRKQCTSCYYKRKNTLRSLKNKIQCIECGEFKLKIQFPNYKALTTGDKRKKICKKCTAHHSYLKRKVRIQNNFEEKVFSTPNRYASDFQKETTFELMQTMGWIFNEDTGKWSKEGIKDKNNNWDNVITDKQRIINQREKLKKYEEEKKIKLDKEILELFGKGNTIYNIQKQTGKSTTYIINKINEANETGIVY